MLNSPGKVVVAMSGGVDSSVAACLLAEQGYEVVGLFMRVGADPAPSARADDANRPEPVACASSLLHGTVSPDAASEPRASARADARRGTPLDVLRGSGGRDDSIPRCDTPVRAGVSAQAEASGSPSTHEPARLLRYPDTSSVPSARSHQGCCSASDASDARYVAGMLRAPFYALNFKQDFDGIIQYFADEYARGRTPNPCVVCNDKLKFGRLLDYADAVGADYVATGHYARIGRRDGRPVLMRGVDAAKDQSYVLFGVDPAVLDRIIFPIGGMTKPEVRCIAAERGLPNQDKPDSVEICFVPDRDYARVVRQRRPDAFQPGDVVDEQGEVIGRHDGLGHFTVGQRRGLRIATGKPIYVTELDVENNRVRTGSADAVRGTSLTADRVRLIDGLPDTFRADVKIRYLHRPATATVTRVGDGAVRVDFEEPQTAITPGQAAVLYDGDFVLGGGWIAGSERGDRSDI